MSKIPKGRKITISDRYYSFDRKIYETPLVPRTKIKQMLERDDAVINAYSIYSSFVLNMIRGYTHKDKDISEFIEKNFQVSKTSISKVLRAMLKEARAGGFSTAEIVYDYTDGKYVVSDITKLEPSRCTFLVDHDDITGIEYVSVKGRNIVVEKEKLLILRFGNGIYGTQEISKAMERWYDIRRDAVICMSRTQNEFSTPPITTYTNDPAETKEQFEKGNIRGGGKIIYLREDEKAEFITIPDASGGLRENIRFAGTKIHDILGIPTLLYENSSTGAYSLGSKQVEVFESIVSDAALIMAEMLLEQIITTLIDYNFGPQEDYGTYDISTKLSIEDLGKLTTVVKNAVESAIIDPTEEWIRPRLGFPKGVNVAGSIQSDIDKENKEGGK